MPNLNVRGVPDDLHKRLQAEAKQTHRSVNAIVIDTLQEHAAQQSRRQRLEEVMDRMDALRNSMPMTTDSALLIREERDR